MQEREYLRSREHPHYCTCVECQTKRTAAAPTKLSSSEKKRRRKARQKAAKGEAAPMDSIWSDDGDPDGQADQPGASDQAKSLGSLLDQVNEIVKQTPKPGSKKKRRKKK